MLKTPINMKTNKVTAASFGVGKEKK